MRLAAGVEGYKARLLAGGIFWVFLLAWGTAWHLSPTAAGTVAAQEPPAAEGDKAAAAEPPPLAAPPGAKPEEKPKQESYLVWFFHALGWRYTVAFLFISFSFVAFLVMNLLAIRRDAICPRFLADAFAANLDEKKFQDAFDLAKNDESMLGQMLAAGMQNLQNGYDKALGAMEQIGEEENLKLEQRLSLISLVGTISPMVGLLGTVDGMVQSFQVIALSNATPKPSELAQGVSMALITTLVGLWLAIPAIISFNLLKNQLTRLTLDVGVTAEQLMGRFEAPARNSPP
jgi:biopolymer transport protein ExbB